MRPGARVGSTIGRAGRHKAVHAVSTPQKTGRGKWWTLGVVGSGTFMSALDASVVNIALPVIGRDTGAGVSTLEWVILAYLITVTASVLVFGRLADIHGRRRIYMAGQLVFTLASLGCGLAGSIGWLIVARVIQAIGAAMIFALSPAILVAAFPRSERGRALGLQATLTYLGMALGPGLGGLLTQHFGWPFIFYINVPVGIVMWAVAYWSLSADQAEDEQPFDPAGAAGMAISLSALLFALSKGGEMGWRHPVIVASMVVGILALAGLLIIESRLQHPALDLRLFANRRFSASIVAAWLCYICSASVSFLIPFLLISSMGLEASKAGLISLVKTLGREVAPEGIIVNAVAPGVTDTPQLEVDADAAGITLADMHARYAESIPLGRIGSADEIAAAVQLLADFDMSAVVGQVSSCNGGATRTRV